MKGALRLGRRRNRTGAGRSRPRGRVRAIVALGLGVLLAGTGVAPAATDAAAPRLDRRELQRTLDEVPAGGVAGAYSAVRAGREHWRGAAGLADLERGRPMRPDMYHRIGSVTKTFVATAVVQQVDLGRIRLDDPVERYLPGLLPDRRITVRMLLNHTSHLGDHDEAIFTGPESIERVRFRRFTPHELVRLGLEVGPSGRPGELPGVYSNTNYIVLGLLLAKVTGMPAERYVTEHVIRRAGLTRTFFPRTPHLPEPHARAYTSAMGSFPLRDFSTYDMSWAGTAGALVSTMDDLNRFFAALGGGRLISAARLAEMRATVPVLPGPGLADLPLDYGLGLVRFTVPCGPVWGHDGGVIGMLTVAAAAEDGTRFVASGINTMWHPEAAAGEEAWRRHLVGAICGTGQAEGDAPAARSAAGIPPRSHTAPWLR
ncbi:serine hydrolase domain-containing protein [Thermopolyspora flexuosa]|uniref:D-alanyl-D-alanine carboxypeptidase n=1 Tax=Thermopolyspora flexuosa TaxID=103836 RepID=A0A543IVP5_9ACTN|nr:serine hydrolase domain-containing protein [Thermopolyspora flexuosa]TQM74653.1 D-alanyl-D-alanine carboxypeptidase [Thermopolyspora flexuosa]